MCIILDIDLSCNGTKIDGVCYTLVTDRLLDWESADEFCHTYFNGALATIETNDLKKTFAPILGALG